MKIPQEQGLTGPTRRLWQSYKRNLLALNRSTATITTYFYAVDSLDSHQGKDILTLSRGEITQWVEWLQGRLSATTVWTYFVSVRAFYNWCVREDYISKSPMASMTPPGVQESEPRVLTEEELKKLLTACKGRDFESYRDTAIIRLLSEAGGPRNAEITSLELEAVDLDNQVIRVLGKGRKVRYVPYGYRTAQTLDRYLYARSKHRLADSPYVFLGKNGPLGRSGMNQMLARRCAQAGIERFSCHTLRHTAAHRAMESGMSDLDIQTLFGWSSPKMMSRYASSTKTQRAITSARRVSLGDRL